jgi:chromate transporter
VRCCADGVVVHPGLKDSSPPRLLSAWVGSSPSRSSSPSFARWLPYDDAVMTSASPDSIGAGTPRPSSTRPWLEVTGVFARLGLTSFGGPAAHIAMMHDEVVRRRAWVTDEEFLDLVGATNLLPGPNSTEMAMHLGSRRAGFLGLVAGGTAFILPPMLIVLVLSYLYVRLGGTPQAGWLLYGIKPVVIAIIVQALFQLGRAAHRRVLSLAIAAVAVVLALAGVNEIPLLLAGGAVVMIAGRAGIVARRPLRSWLPWRRSACRWPPCLSACRCSS